MTVLLRPTTPEDLALVVGIEGDAEVAPWITRWPAERHLTAIRDSDEAHLTILDDGSLVGFILLAGLMRTDRVVELRRIALARRDRGIGRQALAQTIEIAFDRHDAELLWLDVEPENLRARHLYERVCFLESPLHEDHPLSIHQTSLVVMSIRRDRWLANHERR